MMRLHTDCIGPDAHGRCRFHPRRRHHRADSRARERRDHHQVGSRAAPDRGPPPASRSGRACAATTRPWRNCCRDVTPQVIVDAVDELLLTQRGKELGYAMGDDQFKSIVDNIRKENKIETDEQFAQALQQEGMTMLDLRRQLEKQMLVSRVQQTEVIGQDLDHRRRGRGLLRAAQGRVRDHAAGDAPRDPRRRGGHRRQRERGRRRSRPRQGRRHPQAPARRASRSRGWPPTCRTRRRRPTADCSARSPGKTCRPNCRRNSTP